MAVATDVVARRYINITADTPIDVDYPVYEETDVRVIYGKLALVAVLNVDYTVTLDAPNFDTFVVTPTASLLAKINDLIANDPGEINYIVVRRVMDFLTDSTPSAVRYTPFTSREFDRTALRFQQIQENLNRALMLGPNFVGGTAGLQITELEPGHVLIVSDDGTSIVIGPSGDDIANAEQYAEEAKQAALDAEEAAALVRNDWVVLADTVSDGASTDVPLLHDPKTKYNLFVSIGGLTQSPSSYELVYVSGTPVLRLSEAAPQFATIEARGGSAKQINTPADGSVATASIQDEAVTEPKISDSSVSTRTLTDSAVTLAKIQDVATSRVLGRLTSGSGAVEELTAGQLRDGLFPVGSVVDSVYARYGTWEALTAVIPVDGTIPQNTEGTQILSAVLTPKNAANKLRVRFRGMGTPGASPNALAYAIFRSGQADAIDAGWADSANNAVVQLAGEVEVVAGDTSAITFTVRVGPVLAGTAHMNGGNGSAAMSTAPGCTLIVEEIKG